MRTLLLHTLHGLLSDVALICTSDDRSDSPAHGRGSEAQEEWISCETGRVISA